MPRAKPDDPRYTSKLRRIQLHYRGLAEELAWTPARFRRLAGILRLTVHEVGALIRLSPGQTDRILESGAFPPPVELHLTLIERTVFPSSTDPLFPDLSC
jgi:hypothetical protein